MCDTLVAAKNSTKDGSVILAKNSDREPNEGQGLLFLPKQKHDPESEKVKCTYLEVPQVEETYAVVLSAPHWMFGCEMGANEHGVAIGNEAVFTKEPERETGLLGMDMMRLALERSRTAVEALETIVSLLETCGQGGICGFEDKKMKYHNSFLLADLNEAWVLETADKFWIAEKVRDIRTISNCLTVGSQYDRVHPQLIDHAIEKGYCSSRSDFNFRKNFTAGILDKRTWGGKGQTRHQYTTRELEDHKGSIDVPLMMKLLRSHNVGPNEKSWNPSKGGMGSICVHARPVFVPTQTTGSYVGHLLPELQTHWFTGTAAPCTSIFKPVFFKSGLPDLGPPPKGICDIRSSWWLHERVHRKILEDYQTRIAIIQEDRRSFESKYLALVSQLQSDLSDFQPGGDRESALRQLTERTFQEAESLETKWISEIGKAPIQRKPGLLYRTYWSRLNRRAKLCNSRS